jgi:Na+/melibiose symporter-like transporter
LDKVADIFDSYFVPSLLQQNVGLTQNLSLLIGGAVQCMFIVGSIFLDRFGRRRPMMWGSFGLGLSMMMLSVLLSFSRPQFSESLRHATASASVAFLFTYMLIFG